MSTLISIVVWIGIIALAIKGLVMLWYIHALLAVAAFIIASPLLPLVGIFALVTGK